MPLFNGVPRQDINVNYDGKTLPRDAVPLQDVPIDPEVNYAGQTLPQDAVKPVAPTFDPTNNPKLTVIGNTALPESTNVSLTGEKILVQSQIIDGVSVFEHINRAPYEIEFKFLIWDQNFDPVFPQDTIQQIWNNVWLPNSVQKVKNTYLNGLGVSEIIVKSVQPMPRLGSRNVDMVIKAYENQPGANIITGNTIIINF